MFTSSVHYGNFLFSSIARVTHSNVLYLILQFREKKAEDKISICHECRAFFYILAVLSFLTHLQGITKEYQQILHLSTFVPLCYITISE